MNAVIAATVLGCAAWVFTPAAAANRPVSPELPAVRSLEIAPSELTLVAGERGHGVLITGRTDDGRALDLTAAARVDAAEPSIASISAAGRVRGHRAGTTTVQFTFADQSVALPVTVQDSAGPDRVSFLNDVLPVLSRAGCNAGQCHAKPNGQNGFKLSVFAHDPASDYDEIVKDNRGRRIFPGAPAASLLLQKPTLGIEHEGGLRFGVDSEPYQLLVRWIDDGMPYRHPEDPDLLGIEILPAERRYGPDSRQRLLVRASYSDGFARDVTHLAEFQSNDDELTRVDESGEIRTGPVPGETAVVARFMGKVAVSRVLIPTENRLPDAEYFALPVRNEIDRLAYDRFRRLGLWPSEPMTDSEFIRRATLDTIGRLPSVSEVRAFLSESVPDKRDRLIERLLDDPAYADYWATRWADLLRPNPARVGVKSAYVLHEWLRDSFRRNRPYDEMIRELVTARGSTHEYGPAVVYRDRRDPPELTTLFSQVFLGVRLECARCHHHPNERWSQDDFFQFAAFFAEVGRKGKGVSPPISGGTEVIFHKPGGKVTHPVSGSVMKPVALAANAPAEIESGSDPRARLAAWITDPRNPFFARAAANRVWANFFGHGIVEPVDDFRASNPATNPELLDALAGRLVEARFDLKALMRMILQSNLYQQQSEPNAWNGGDTTHFSRAYRRRIPGEVLLDTVTQLTGRPDSFASLPAGSRAVEAWNYRMESDFLDAFGRPNSSQDCPCERDSNTSVTQALHLMNSENLHERLAHPEGTVARLAASDRSDADMVEELYLMTFSRFPEPDEKAAALRAFTNPDATRRTAAEDVLWALINSAEFVFNH